jgi:hypothetical protein
MNSAGSDGAPVPRRRRHRHDHSERHVQRDPGDEDAGRGAIPRGRENSKRGDVGPTTGHPYKQIWATGLDGRKENKSGEPVTTL